MVDTLPDVLDFAARLYTNRPAVIFGGLKITFGEFNQTANKIASALHRFGVEKGDRIGLYLPSQPILTACYFATQKLGGVPVMLNYMLKEKEIQFIASNSGMKIIITTSTGYEIVAKALSSLPKLQNVVVAGGSVPQGCISYEEILKVESPDFQNVPCSSGDLAAIMYTSGTTGVPKGVMLTHLNLLWGIATWHSVMELSEGSIYVSGMPLFNDAGCHSVMPVAFYYGATVVLTERFNAIEILENITKYRGTHFFSTMTMCHYVCDAYDPKCHDLSSLRVSVTGGSKVPDKLLRDFQAKAPNCILTEAYGLTEARLVTGVPPHKSMYKIGSMGRALAGQRVRLVDDEGKDVATHTQGELVVSSPGVTKGYYLNDQATAEAWRGGWFHTGDICYKDEDGYFYYADRAKDVLRTGGQYIFPREVEEHILQHPKVASACVIGMPDPIKEEIPAAVIVLKEGEKATEEEIIQYCREHMAVYKAPRKVRFVSELPMNAMGRVLRRELRDQWVKAKDG